MNPPYVNYEQMSIGLWERSDGEDGIQQAEIGRREGYIVRRSHSGERGYRQMLERRAGIEGYIV